VYVVHRIRQSKLRKNNKNKHFSSSEVKKVPQFKQFLSYLFKAHYVSIMDIAENINISKIVKLPKAYFVTVRLIWLLQP
jgi:hypothetical protein